MKTFEFLERGLDKLLDRIIEDEGEGNHYYTIPLSISNSNELPLARISVEELVIYEGENTQMLHVQYFFEKECDDLDKIIKEKKWELLSETKEKRVYMHKDEPVNLNFCSDCLEVSYHIDRNKRFDKGEYSFVLIQLFNYLIDIFKREESHDKIEELDFAKYDLIDIRDPQIVDKANKIHRETQEGEPNGIPLEITASKKSLVVNGCKGVVWYYANRRQIRAAFPLTLNNKNKLKDIKLPFRYRINGGSYGIIISLDRKPPLNDSERTRFERTIRTIVHKLS